jgi:flavin-dependent dehydrogenase
MLSKRSGGERGFGGLMPLGEPGLFRFIYGNRNERPDDMRAPVADAEIVAELQKRYGEETEVAKVVWSSRFSDAARQADRYRVGRVLLAGDAAHIHFPAGGQGLNLGVQDAMNLGWKLAAEVRGRAPEGLLDTYESERHPVGARVLENVHAQKALFPQGPESSALRGLFVELAKNPAVTRQLAGMVSGLDIRYEMDGPAHGLLGARLPDVKLDVDGEQRWASDLMHSGRGVLLTTEARHYDQVDVVLVPELPGLDADALLVRPDGYVCWVGLDGLDTPIARWFG